MFSVEPDVVLLSYMFKKVRSYAMQQRLMRSRTDVMFVGVCGGLAEYFTIDPVIVRLIFVLVTLTSGFGIPVYLLLWFVMPKQPERGTSHQSHASISGTASPAHTTSAKSQNAQIAAASGSASQPQAVLHQRVSEPGTFVQEPPPPDAYKFNPQTGQPIQPDTATTGETIRLEFGAPQAATQTPASTPAQSSHSAPGVTHQPANTTSQQPPRRNWRKLGSILIAVGALVLINQIGVSMGYIIPPLMIIAGVVLLRRNR